MISFEIALVTLMWVCSTKTAETLEHAMLIIDIKMKRCSTKVRYATSMNHQHARTLKLTEKSLRRDTHGKHACTIVLSTSTDRRCIRKYPLSCYSLENSKNTILGYPNIFVNNINNKIKWTSCIHNIFFTLWILISSM